MSFPLSHDVWLARLFLHSSFQVSSSSGESISRHRHLLLPIVGSGILLPGLSLLGLLLTVLQCGQYIISKGIAHFVPLLRP